MLNEDWNTLKYFFPERWQELALEHGALKGLRKNKSAENLLRTLLIHLSCGCSLRETVVRARKAGFADLSDVALMKRLKKSKGWLHSLCIELFKERGIAPAALAECNFRAFDATTVKEPGKTGSLWRIHYSLKIPALECDFFKITQTSGKYTGESFSQFPIQKDDYIFADRGYSIASGIAYAASHDAYTCVRINTQALKLYDKNNADFSLLDFVSKIENTGQIKSTEVSVLSPEKEVVSGRLCVLRKSQKAIDLAVKKLKRQASKKGHQLKPETLRYAEYVILFTTFPVDNFTAEQILEWYRIRWQVELIFKRFKQIAQLGHLPKRDSESALAWLYGKLLVALIAEKIISHAVDFSPWGYSVLWEKDTKPLERV